jgi:2-amino-4-hydroxy-6-hydroxymethyldihydropteridine diphosphokinase
MMNDVYIGLGSNLNDPAQQLHQAITALKEIPHTEFIIASSFYQTKPVGFSEQPDFINAVAKLTTSLSPQILLTHLQQIEKNQGRIRTQQRNGPRTLDLDILLFGDITLNEESLTLPHPRMFEREFVLIPLREIYPGIMDRLKT